MKQALVLLIFVIASLEIAYQVAGYEAVLLVVYGAIALMALMIAATFLWLWFERTTPLALGMVYSWSGIGLVTGWWWLYNLLGQPVWADEHPGLFVVLAFHVVGAVLHFAVIHRSFGFHGVSFLWPVVLAMALSTGVYVLI